MACNRRGPQGCGCSAPPDPCIGWEDEFDRAAGPVGNFWNIHSGTATIPATTGQVDITAGTVISHGAEADGSESFTYMAQLKHTGGSYPGKVKLLIGVLQPDGKDYNFVELSGTTLTFGSVMFDMSTFSYVRTNHRSGTVSPGIDPVLSLCLSREIRTYSVPEYSIEFALDSESFVWHPSCPTVLNDHIDFDNNDIGLACETTDASFLYARVLKQTDGVGNLCDSCKFQICICNFNQDPPFPVYVEVAGVAGGCGGSYNGTFEAFDGFPSGAEDPCKSRFHLLDDTKRLRFARICDEISGNTLKIIVEFNNEATFEKTLPGLQDCTVSASHDLTLVDDSGPCDFSAATVRVYW